MRNSTPQEVSLGGAVLLVFKEGCRLALSRWEGALGTHSVPLRPTVPPAAADQAGAFWAMLGQGVQADAGRACGSPAAAARLAQAVANAPMVMASAGKIVGSIFGAFCFRMAGWRSPCSHLGPTVLLPPGALCSHAAGRHP